MSRIMWCAVTCGLALVAVPGAADEVKPVAAKQGDRLERVLAALDQEVQLKEGANVNEVPLYELITYLSKQYHLTFIINEGSFDAAGLQNIKEAKARTTPTQLQGISLRQFLSLVLDDLGGTYLVKNGSIEIVSVAHAAKVTKSAFTPEADVGDRPRLAQPLVSAVFKEVPLNDAVAKIAEIYDLTAIVSPLVGDLKTEPITARLLNVPLEQALELLAVQRDLRVVRKGNAFLVTTKEQADELLNEELDKARQKIELGQP